MDNQSKFLPDSVSGALKSFAWRVCGVALILVGLWMIGTLMFHNPYLDGFAAASTVGNQTVMGNIVGFVRYMIGFVPALFVFLCVACRGLVMVLGRDNECTPEYNFLRGFVAVCCGAAGFGMILPGSTFGGMIGCIAAADVAALIGGWTIGVGILLLWLFFVIAAMILHVRYAHVRAAVVTTVRAVRMFMSVFHMRHVAARAADVADGTSDDEYDADDVSDDAGEYDDADDAESEDEEYDDDADEEEDGTDDEDAPKKAPAARGKSTATRRRKTRGEYKLPSPNLLESSSFGRGVVTSELKQNAKAMEEHFAEYGVRGRVTGIRPGPIVTLYEFLPDSGTKMNDVTSTVKDMTRAMATENIRIAHIPGTQLIGVEMVNLNRQTVRYRSLVGNTMFVNSKYKIPLALGVDIGGNPMYFDLAKMPHMLVAGRTGSGKSVFVQSIITSVIYHFTPDKCKLIIIDPKGVDFGFWDDIPHLITPIVKLDPAAAVNALKWAVREMEDRYKQMALLNARNIESYNENAAARRASGEPLTRQVAVGTDEETGELLFETQEIDLSDMPYIVIIIDEVADLMTLARKEVETCVMRIAQKARAAGIHLVMATQRPDATVITGTIKANFPTRISFQARSNIDSRTTLGEGGAENLLACGDMLFSEGGKPAVRIHGAFISDEELTSVGNFLRTQGEPEYADGVTDGGDDEMAGAPAPKSAAEIRADKNADLYEQAKEIVLRDKKTSISYLQRRLSIGYNKAASIMERMEAEGVISGPDVNNKRHIL